MQAMPFAAACERNKAPILAVLRDVFVEPATLVEIGAGTGQHAVYFAAQLPRLRWIASEAPARLPMLAPRLAASGLANLQGALALDVTADTWPLEHADAAYAANVAHIMSWQAVAAMFAGLGRVLAPGSAFCLYGPFNDASGFTSDSNAAFDAALRARDPAMGLRSVRALQGLGANAGLQLEAEHDLPAHNQVLVWRKLA